MITLLSPLRSTRGNETSGRMIFVSVFDGIHVEQEQRKAEGTGWWSRQSAR
ncbi:MAG TPA: hypothetical protein VF551_02010 [Chthoniobacterales bacterium]